MPPQRDLYQLAQRLRLKSTEPIPRVVNSQPVSYQVGQKQEFWAVDMEKYTLFRMAASLRVVTPHAYFYTEDAVSIPQDALERAAAEFEQHIYPTVTGYVGTEWRPGVDNDTHLTILNGRIPGVAGYFSASDEYPRAVNPYSNEREMIYINVSSLQPGTPTYSRVLAHELTHAATWRPDDKQETWFAEGLAELVARLAGYDASFPPAFMVAPDTSLTVWEDEPSHAQAHYGAAYLFMRYLAQHYGGYSQLQTLLQEPADGTAGIDAYLKKLGYSATFDSVFRDWVVANYLDLPSGPYGYTEDNVRTSISTTVTTPGQTSGTVHQYAADYIELSPGGKPLDVSFSGNTTVNALPTQAHSGRYMWWGNRGDSIDSTLTREFDLTGLKQATLNFWVWYDIEQGWDYAYVEASTDSGQTWSVLPGQHTTTDNPVGNSFGAAYTSSSGGWQPESVDLTPYAGGKVWLRFEYIADEAVSRDGFAIDDISIPELGFRDGAETDAGWMAQGFMRTDNRLKQGFAVQLIAPGADPPVRQVAMDANQQGRVHIDGLQRAVLVVAATTPSTGQLAQYTVSITPASSSGG